MREVKCDAEQSARLLGKSCRLRSGSTLHRETIVRQCLKPLPKTSPPNGDGRHHPSQPSNVFLGGMRRAGAKPLCGLISFIDPACITTETQDEPITKDPVLAR